MKRFPVLTTSQLGSVHILANARFEFFLLQIKTFDLFFHFFFAFLIKFLAITKFLRALALI